MFPQFSGSSRTRQINLGSSSSTTSSTSSVIANARAERQARERLRAEIDAAIMIQSAWRGRRIAAGVKEELLHGVRNGETRGERAAMALALVFLQGYGKGETVRYDAQAEAVLSVWCESSLSDTDSVSQMFFPSSNGGESHFATLRRLCTVLLQLVARDASTPSAVIYLKWLERALGKQSTFETAGQLQAYQSLAADLVVRGWAKSLANGFEGIQPSARKKHPATPIIIRLVTLIIPAVRGFSWARMPLAEDILGHLFTIPSLPSNLPLKSLTHLCAHMHLFDIVLPAGWRLEGGLKKGPLASMAAKTCLLANLSTIVIRGGLLAKQDENGIRVWMDFLGVIFKGLSGWGLWLDAGSHAEGVQMASSTKVVEPLPSKAVIASATLLLGRDHLKTLQSRALRSPATSMGPFIDVVLAMLQSVRGTASWEAIVDTLLEGEDGVALLLGLWRTSVRGRWPSQEAMSRWGHLYILEEDNVTKNDLPPLVLLSILYTHHLTTLPDTEFFSTDPTIRKQTLPLDDVLDLARIWRDLAFMGFWIGLSPRLSWAPTEEIANKKEIERNKEYLRSIFARALTAVCSRDARRRFAPEGYWIVNGYFDIESFIDAVCMEETQLEEEQLLADEAVADGGTVGTNIVPPAWVRARKAISKRQMALISPRLGLLNNLPMTLPFESRVAIFDQFIYNDRHRLGIERYSRRQGMIQHAKIRRSHLSEDGFRELDKLGPLLKSTIQIEFIDQWGQVETGIDGGGLFKEFLTSLAKEVFDPSRGLWLTTTRNELWPNPHGYAREPFQLAWYQFLGRVLGKALYEGILVDVGFAGFFLAKWLGRQSYLDDLASLDPELYKGLISLKNYPGDPEDLSLNFVVSEEDMGVTRNVELVRNGANIAVTKSNRTEYIQAMCAYKLNSQIAQQSESFFSGLSDIIDTKWLRMFDQQELQMLIGGVDYPIDVDDLRQNAVTPDGDDQQSITLFWKVVKSMSQSELKALLRFVTSVGRPPLLGFASLNPRFGIRLAGDDQTRLPSASACANLLKLPRYRDEYTLKSKLLQAINSNAGFDLS